MSILLTWVAPFIPWIPGTITYGTLFLNYIRSYFRKD
jgi:hypothetical protein